MLQWYRCQAQLPALFVFKSGDCFPDLFPSERLRRLVWNVTAWCPNLRIGVHHTHLHRCFLNLKLDKLLRS